MGDPPVTRRLATPPPGRARLDEVLARRRSVRDLGGPPLTEDEISRLLFAAQGITGPMGERAAPSAGATYPLELLVVTGDGVDRYDASLHALTRVVTGDVRPSLARAALGQACVGMAPATFAFSAVESRTAGRYGARAERYVWLEAGHAAQNLLLEAVALGLGAVAVGAFHDEEASEILELSPEETLLYLIPVGRPR